MIPIHYTSPEESIKEEFTTHVPQEMLLSAASVEEIINSASVTRDL